ncbi:MAG: hypothetical protein NUV57_00340 [archaeon]|nr:hypothetical protein [archaeon]
MFCTYSYLRASTGLSLAAERAGRIPETTPITADIRTAIIIS